MLRTEKERVVAELAKQLGESETLMVADYRGLTMPEIDELRSRLLDAGARFRVVKNTLTKLAAEQAGTTDVLQLIDGPTAIAFLDAEGDPVAVAKVLNEVARANDVLVIRGGLLEGTIVGEDEIKRLATLPPADVLRAQLVGALSAPMATVVGVFSAPLRDFVGVLQARIDQLEARGESAEAAPATEVEPEPEPEPEPAAEAEQGEPEAEDEEAPSDGEES